MICDNWKKRNKSLDENSLSRDSVSKKNRLIALLVISATAMQPLDVH